jgi:metal-responsive CopG/Arc/MetJ family transcriptional regulator
MKSSQLFTLDVNLISELKRTIKKGSRSKFVENAIRARLDGRDSFNAGDLPERQIMAMLVNRLEKRTDAASLMVLEFLYAELGL